jgi:UDP-N-acetylmuramoyl-L-alanyl-D-glutamate--2,6-diaminopimelate ligase
MRLLEFVSLIQPQRGDGPLNREVNGAVWDCRRVSPGNLFVAIPAPGRDTQASVDIAIERGATAVLCEGREVVGLKSTRIQVANVRAALPRVAELFFGQPDRRLKVIGVAGSGGTAAPAKLLKSILDAAGFKCGLIGSAGCEIGERQLPPLRKNSESLDYHELMAQMVRAGCMACIIEFGPEAVEQKKVTDLAFDAVVFTSFEPQIIPGRGAALLQFCMAQSSGSKRFTAAFNIDDPIGQALFESGACRQRLSFGFNASAEVRGSNLELAHGSIGMLIAAGESEIRLRSQLTGRQNAFNLLAATAAAVTLQIPLALIRFTLQKVKVLPGSLEPVGNGDIQVYVDAAKTDESLRRALESLVEITRGSVLLAIGSAAGESMDARRQLGVAAAALADYTVLTSDNPGRENAREIAEQIERGFPAGGARAHEIELDRAQAIEDVVNMAQPGDSILIAGKGSENHQELADTLAPFDDREYAIAALESRGTTLAKEIRAVSHVDHAPSLAAVA